MLLHFHQYFSYVGDANNHARFELNSRYILKFDDDMTNNYFPFLSTYLEEKFDASNHFNSENTSLQSVN